MTAAQLKSNKASAGDVASVWVELDNWQGVSAIHFSHETKCRSPPRFWVCLFTLASTRKFLSDLINNERKRPRAGSADCNSLPSRITRKKSCVRSCASWAE